MIACFDSIILHDLERLDVELCVRGSGGYWASMRIESNLMLQIIQAQRERRLCVFPNDQTLREKVMTEAHSSPFTIQSRSKLNIRGLVVWIQPLEIPMWKWDEISMDFVLVLPTTQKKHNAIWGQLKEAYSPDRKLMLDKLRPDLEFQVGDRVFQQVSPNSSKLNVFGIKRQAAQSLDSSVRVRFGTYWRVANRLALFLPVVAIVHKSFYNNEPESNLDRPRESHRNKVNSFVRSLWKNHPEREATWENRRVKCY
ncbi:hypothetical protein Tco_0439938 [Tanacetum coccineum]